MTEKRTNGKAGGGAKRAGPVRLRDFGETLTPVELARVLGVGRNGAYQAVSRGEVPSIRVGRRILIPRAALERVLGGT
jgi:excisionase family DNA binding protein